MDDVEQAILDAWNRLKPQLLRDSAELQRRLARRSRPSLQRPPRAWCLAVRAADTRLNQTIATIVPDHAVDIHSPQHPGRLVEHQVTLTASTLFKLCKPVTIDWPGEQWDDVACKLGVLPVGLRTARINGVVRTKYVPLLGGRPGRPVPVLYCDHPLDPCSRGFFNPDPLWGWTAQYLPTRLARDFVQTLQRVPLYRDIAGKRRSPDAPSHPEVDPVPPPSKYVRRLPKPPPDYVWYKWKDGKYVGDAIEQRTREANERRRQRQREHYRDHPRPSRAAGSLSFRGFQWICPRCHKTANTLYLPLPPINLLRLKDEGGRLKGEAKLGSISSFILPPSSFACCHCHRVQFFTRASGDAWNQLIGTLSGGLLFGKEVPKPADFKPVRRRRPYHPIINRPSPVREKVLEMLLAGLSRAQIAQRLKIQHISVNNHTHKIYHQHGVHSQQELATKLGIKLPRPPTKRELVRRLLAAGKSRKQIAAELGISWIAVYRHEQLIRRAGVRDGVEAA